MANINVKCSIWQIQDNRKYLLNECRFLAQVIFFLKMFNTTENTCLT